MADVDFSDFDSAKAWFAGQSIETRCAISSRAALRVCANICAIEGEARNTLALAVLRAILTSADRGLGRRTDVNWYAAAAFSAHSAAANFSAAESAAFSAAESAAFSAATAPDAAADSATKSAARSAVDDSAAARSATSWDAAQPASTLYSNKVWAGAQVPAAIADNHSIFLAFLRSDPAWAFWLQFYEGMWEGTFTNWDLAFEVIQIDKADWEKGYARIGEMIAELARKRVSQSVSDLQLDADQTAFNRHGIGGNSIPADEELLTALNMVNAGVAQIKQQSESGTPQKSLVERGMSRTVQGLAAILKWLSQKADYTVEQLIKWGVPAVCLHLIANPAKVQAVIDAAKAWLPFI